MTLRHAHHRLWQALVNAARLAETVAVIMILPFAAGLEWLLSKPPSLMTEAEHRQAEKEAWRGGV